MLAARCKWLRKWGKKGYAQLATSHGNLNVELHVDIAPRAAENFLGLCAKARNDVSQKDDRMRSVTLRGKRSPRVERLGAAA